MIKALWLVVLAGCPELGPSDTVATDAATDVTLEFRTIGFTDEGFFLGRWMNAYGEGLKPIARGGVEWVRVTGLPFDGRGQDIAAESDGALSIASIDRSAAFVHVRGDEVGDGELRVARASDASVHDRSRMEVHEAERLMLLPPTFPPGHAELVEEDYPFASWKLFAGENRAVTLGLVDGGGDRLVDHEMSFAVTSGDVTVRRPVFTPAWDFLVFDAPTAGTVGVRATLSGGTTLDAEIEVVEHADSIRGSTWNESWYPYLRLDYSSVIFCFGAYAGESSRVLGVTWSYAASENIELAESGYANCPRLRPRSAGPAWLAVTAGGHRLEVPLIVLPRA